MMIIIVVTIIMFRSSIFPLFVSSLAGADTAASPAATPLLSFAFVALIAGFAGIYKHRHQKFDPWSKYLIALVRKTYHLTKQIISISLFFSLSLSGSRLPAGQVIGASEATIR
jgi:hypothetical protein